MAKNDRDVTLSEEVRYLQQQTTADAVRAVGLGVFAMVPIVGPMLAATAAEVVTSRREERMRDVASKLAEAVDVLGIKVDSLEGRVPDDYVDIFETVIENAVRTGEEEKRAAYAAILANALRETEATDEERMLFVDLLDRCRPLHIRLLGLLADPEPTQGAEISMMGGSLLPIVKARLPEYSDDMIRLAWGDLSGWGLVNTDASSLGAMMSRPSLAGRLTDVGRSFVAFITIEERQPA